MFSDPHLRGVGRVNVTSSLGKREINTRWSCRHNQKIVKRIICQTHCSYRKVWKTQSKQRIITEMSKLYMNNYKTCFHIHGVNGIPSKAYNMPAVPASKKIEDCLVCATSLERTDLNHHGYKSCLVVVTADRWLRRYDMNTGRMLEEVYIGPNIKFKYLAWDREQERLVIKSTHSNLSQAERQAGVVKDVLMTMGVFHIFPLEFLAMFQVRKSIFGKSITDAMLFGGLLLVMSKSDVIKIYSFDDILEQFKEFNAPLGNDSTHYEGHAGRHPHGLPVNVTIKDCPPVLFEVQSSQFSFTIGANPYHFIITPVRTRGIFEVHTLKTKKKVLNGHLDMDSSDLDKAFFHPDETSRIIHTGDTSFQMLQVRPVSERSEEYELRPTFSIDVSHKICDAIPHMNGISSGPQELLLKSSLGPAPPVRSSSGRCIKMKASVYSDFLVNESPHQKLHSVDYEYDLDLLIVTVYDVAGDFKGYVHFHDNYTGDLIKEVQLQETWEEHCEHTIEVDMDTIVHTVKSADSGKYICYIYKAQRHIDDLNIHKKRSKRNSRQSRSNSLQRVS
ncbi:unnamed protein product [Owenia fusiformis]|uniref:Uncharacterized protein n=1 Tax=Owenia fusiformis TaxID=6347 RepID=A0A8J1UDY2_OWEFU|nr:unnamed protein product [Owenia fusiformis]